MLFLLKRNSLIEKKKKKKGDFDKISLLVKQKIEFDLKQQNKKSDIDYVDLDSMPPETVKFALTSELRSLLPNISKQL